MSTQTDPSPTAITNAENPADQAQPAEKAKPRKPWYRRVLRLVLMLVYLTILLEIGSRAYWAIKYDMPVFPTVDDFYGRFYPELEASGVQETQVRQDDQTVDVLLLGGSVLAGFDLSASDEFADRLSQQTGRPVKVYSLARPALSSRDSLIKYERLLRDDGFDVVVFYHGINETRMNNAPPKMFKDDYTHAGWYKQIERLEAYRGCLWAFTLPYTAEYTFIHALAGQEGSPYIPRRRPDETLLEYGSDIKSAKPFEHNILRILEIARRRGHAQVVLPTFAYHIADGYSLEAFQAGTLDYDDSIDPKHLSPIETWGKVDNVRKGMDVHNEVIRRIAASPEWSEQLIYVDVAERMPDDGKLFHDVCHFNDAGKARLIELLVPAIADRINALSTRPADLTD